MPGGIWGGGYCLSPTTYHLPSVSSRILPINYPPANLHKHALGQDIFPSKTDSLLSRICAANGRLSAVRILVAIKPDCACANWPPPSV